MTLPVPNLKSSVDTPAPSAARWMTVVREAPIPLVQAVAIAILLYVLFEGWKRDLGVPIGFSADSLWYLMQSKSTVDNGWWWWNPRLGMPFGLDEVAFPANSTVDQAIVWLVSRMVPDAMTAVNLSWAAMVVLSGLAATWCLRTLGVSRISAFVAGTLFALSPYALYRHIDHFGLVIYLVPFACAAALRLAAGEPHREWDRRSRVLTLAGCVLLGLNYVYYAFFGSFCIAAGAVIGHLRGRDRRVLLSGALCIALISGSTLVNLAPSFGSWHRNGRPIFVRDKTPAESEMFALKIRQLVSPVFPNHLTPLHTYVEREAAARFPNDNENWSTRLGLVATLGFIGLLGLLFAPDNVLRVRPVLRGASRLTLAALLLATVGGFGAVFNLLVAPDIRAYNRISPFIAFFSLLAVVAVLDSVFKSRVARTLAALVLFLVGIGDQGQATRRINERHADIAAEISRLTAFVRTLERALPESAMVLQLPFRSYMSERDFGRMQEYDHFKPYLVSQTLRFSYPALSNAQVRWQQAASRLDLRTLTSRMSAQGFAAVVVDRYGYEDSGDAVTAGLLRIVGDEHLIARNDRFVAFDIAGIGSTEDTAGVASMEPVALTLSLSVCVGGPQVAKVVKVEDQVNQIGFSYAPFDPSGARAPADEDFKVYGWAVDHPSRAPASGVDVVIDRMVFPSTYGAYRKDVADYFRRPEYRETGFTAIIPANTFAAGEHWLSLRVVNSDGRCYYQSPSFRLTVE